MQGLYRPFNDSLSIVRAARRSAVGLLICAVLAACVSEDDREITLSRADDGLGRLAVPAPDFLTSRAIDPDQLVLGLTVNGNEVTVQREGDLWSGSVKVPPGTTAVISLDWSERVRGRVLMLARYENTINAVSSDQSIVISNDDYRIDFDDDADSVTNLAERRTDSDPFDNQDPDANFALVRLPAINPSDAPVIDGAYDGIWDTAEYLDVNRQTLSINNLMIDMGAVLANDEAGYRWGGMHDGEYLYLVAFGEGEGGSAQTPFGDSDQIFNDDTLNVFWDADNSALREYDGVNDFQLLISLLGRGDDAIPNSSRSENKRFRPGSNSSFFPDEAIDFATCVCRDDSNFWELRIRLSDAAIVVGQTFGFEMQLDDDRDGGTRDVKWGWQHPSRDGQDRDFTWFDPSFMGTAVLEPPN